MTWYIYPIAPIEFNWAFCKTVDETVALISSKIFSLNLVLCPTLEDFEQDWKDAQNLAIKNGWSGKFNKPPVVYWFPNQGIFEYGFAFTDAAEEAGSFVISPVEMPWFDD